MLLASSSCHLLGDRQWLRGNHLHFFLQWAGMSSGIRELEEVIGLGERRNFIYCWNQHEDCDILLSRWQLLTLLLLTQVSKIHFKERKEEFHSFHAGSSSNKVPSLTQPNHLLKFSSSIYICLFLRSSDIGFLYWTHTPLHAYIHILFGICVFSIRSQYQLSIRSQYDN